MLPSMQHMGSRVSVNHMEKQSLYRLCFLMG